MNPDPCLSLLDTVLELSYRIHTLQHQRAIKRGLTELQDRIITTLYHQHQSTVGDLAVNLRISQPTVSDSVRTLVRKKYASQSRDATNHRVKVLALTQTGKSLYEHNRYSNAPLYAAVSAFTSRERTAYAQLSRKLLDKLQREI